MVETHLVTGAFGYSGSYIARRLLDAGHAVRTLTNSSDRAGELRGRIAAFPLDFDDEAGLARALDGVDVLYNTYWVRFSKAGFSQSRAVENAQRLFAAARRANVGRVVHLSVLNPSPKSPWEYYRGKARMEEALRATGLPHSILRPAVLFGGPDVLINNIAWMLRRFPVFAIFGSGEYRVQPIHVEDLADLAVAEGRERGDRLIDAIGPETYAYRDLVAEIGRAIGHARPLISVPRPVGRLVGGALGAALRDVVITDEEIGALMDGLLAADSQPVGKTRLSSWMRAHPDELGTRYASELERRRDRKRAYAEL